MLDTAYLLHDAAEGIRIEVLQVSLLPRFNNRLVFLACVLVRHDGHGDSFSR